MNLTLGDALEVAAGFVKAPFVSSMARGCGVPLPVQHGPGRPAQWCTARRCQRSRREGASRK